MLGWTFENFDEMVTSVFSEDGSSNKVTEVNFNKSFLNAMESIFYEAGTTCILFLVYCHCNS